MEAPATAVLIYPHRFTVGGNHGDAAYTPDEERVLCVSLLALVALILYFLGTFGIIGGGFQAVARYAFWAAVLGWLAMTVGVAAKGI